MKGRLILIALSLAYNIVLAQQPYLLPEITPKSPNAAGLEKYGKIPVSLATGMPNISIPLTSISIDNLTIPITLNYHNNGLKVEEIASMTGHGWDLSFGGMISYSQRGINDFNTTANGLHTSYHLLRDYMSGTLTSQQNYQFCEDILNGLQDNDFDSYTLNFLGHTNTLYFDTSGNAVLTPKSDLRVYKIDTGLKVIDNQGNQFFFQAAEGATSYETTVFYVSPTFSDVSAWYLSKIITNNNREVRFKYKQYTLDYIKTSQTLSLNNSGICGMQSNDYIDIQVSQTFLLPDSIVFDQGFVKFNLNTTPRLDILRAPLYDSIPSLTGFYVANNRGQKVSEFEFSQSYFDSNARLKLTSVLEKSGGTNGRVWRFKYFGETSTFPSITSHAKDHWGYYNGQTDNTTNIPEADYAPLTGGHWHDFLSGHYANRRSDFTYSELGMLQTIQYPTGGTTTLDYEPNQVKVKDVSDILIYPFLKWTSGLPTISVPLAGANTVYTGTTSGSFTITQPTIGYMTAFQEIDYPSYLNSSAISFTGPDSGVASLYSIVNQSLHNEYTQGFGEVLLTPGTYNWSVYQGYNYDIPRDLHCNFELSATLLDSAHIPPFQVAGGRIHSMVSYDSVANVRMSAKRYVYSDSMNAVVFRNVPYYVKGEQFATTVTEAACGACGHLYKVVDESLIPFVGNNIEYINVTELEDTSGNGGKTEYTFLPSTDDGGSDAPPYAPAFNTSWQVGSILTKKIYRFDSLNHFTLVRQVDNGYTSGTKERFVNGIRVDYDLFGQINSDGCRHHITAMSTLFTRSFYQNQSITKDILNDTVTTITNTSVSSPYHQMPTLIEKFDSEGRSLKEKTIYSFDYDTTHITSLESIALRDLVRKNILVPIEKIQIKTIHDTDYVVASTLYTYKPGKAVADTIFSLKVTAPILYTAYTLSNINGSGIFIKDSHYERRLIENKYDAFNNVVEQQKSTDVKATYVWDYNNYYPIAEVVNSDSASVAYTSFESNGNGNWTIGGSSRDTTQGLTGHTSYQLSNGNLSKTGLADSIEYSLSYWTKNSSAFNVTGTQGTPQQGRTINGWTCFVHKIKGLSQVTLSGTGILDEVRLYPWSAQMTTYTYDPLIGITSQCDPRNSIYYYEYDAFSRLKRVEDQDGNILKTYTYTYQEQQ
jgi:YD repeat-containing protein